MKEKNLLFKRAMLALCLLAVCWLPAIADVMLGDVDNNGTVEISDVTRLIDYLLTYDASVINLEKSDVNLDGQVSIADVSELIDLILTIPSQPHPASDYVDLGLTSGTLWATCNVGASAPEGYGDYFEWGETAPKDSYSWTAYKWCNGSDNTMTKYCTQSSYGNDGFVDNKTELDPFDDAAYINWGPSWRTPSMDQYQELCDQCTIQWTTINGVNGMMVTGPNGNTMFLPAPGYHWYDNVYDLNDWGYYWSRTLYSDSNRAYCIYFYYYYSVEHWGMYYYQRAVGHPVRAVRVS